MKSYIYLQGRALGPYLAEEINGLFGGVSPETLACTEAEFDGGSPDWRKVGSFPELAGCVRNEISEPLVKCAWSAPKGLSLDILSTDDDSNIRALLWHMLTDAGHTVEFAKDGEEVFRRLAAKRYDLVVLDVNMPKMNGYKVSELIHDKLTHPPKVIIFTGRDLEKERLQFVCSGADAILNKGTGNDKLIETIAELFAEKPRQPAALAPAFIPEPQPPALEELSLNTVPAKLEKEAFYEPAAEPARPLPAAPEPAAAKTEVPPRPAAYPAQPPEISGSADPLFSRLLLENKALKADMTDIRRLLGHIELEYAQMEKQLEKQVFKLAAENREASRELGGEWKSLRNYVTLVALFLLITIFAAVFLR